MAELRKTKDPVGEGGQVVATEVQEPQGPEHQRISPLLPWKRCL